MSELKKTVAGNPLLILLLGACPAMGATGTLLGAVGMGIAVLAVMLLSVLVLGALKKAIPESARIPAAVLVTTGFASLVQMVMNAFLPEMYQLMGIYAAVIAVNLLVFGVAEEAAAGTAGIAAALKTALRFLVILVVMGAVREVLGSASIAGFDIAFLADYKISLMTKAPGGFILLAFVAGVVSKLHPNCGAASGCCCECEKEGN